MKTLKTVSTLLVLTLALSVSTSLAQSKSAGTQQQLTAYSYEFDTLITPTNEWINVYCDGPELDGMPLMTGDTIKAYDPDGVLCGIDTVRTDGKYGFLPIYRDDVYSSEDEGAEPGDTIRFMINGTMVTTGAAIVWTENGDSYELCAFSSEATEVYVDIKPGSCPNPFNTTGNMEKGKSVLPVAILGTDGFEVSDVDPTTVTLAGVAPERFSYEDVATPFDRGEGSCDCTSEHGDGYTDMTLKFLRYDILKALGNVSDREYVTLTLKGELYDGTSITGSDCVWILGDYNVTDGETADSSILKTGNHPNPFNPSTIIQFTMPISGRYTLEVFDIQGRQVATYTGVEGIGEVSVEFDASELASGLYLYRVSVDQWQETKKMLLLK